MGLERSFKDSLTNKFKNRFEVLDENNIILFKILVISQYIINQKHENDPWYG